MKDNYELKNPKPNPYSERMKNGYTIIIERNPNNVIETDDKKTESNQIQQTESQK